MTLINTDVAEEFTVRRGDRIAQLVVQRVERAHFVEVDAAARLRSAAHGGHGSTGGFSGSGALPTPAGPSGPGPDDNSRRPRAAGGNQT